MRNLLSTKTKIAMVFFLAVLLAGSNVYAQQTKNALFKQADVAMQNAKAINADLHVPSEYSKALNYYEDAETDFDNKNGIEKVEKNLVEAIEIYRKAELSAIKRVYLLKSESGIRQKSYYRVSLFTTVFNTVSIPL